MQMEYSKLNLWLGNSEVADSWLMEYEPHADRPEKLATTIRAVRLQLHENQVCTLTPRPHYAGGIWKRSFISPVRPSVHTNPVILSTENSAFRKRSWKRRNLKTELCVLVWMESILKTELFENDDVTIIRWFVCPSPPQTQLQNGGRNSDCHVDFATWIQPCYAHAHGCTQAFLPPVIVAFSNFSGVVWTETILSIF